jgi:UDP-3-O-[3-hydroxymyristoyl] N-acetylglucosamine deacetylase
MVSIEPLTADDTDVGHDLHISVDVDFGERIQDGAGGRQRAEFWRKDFLTEAAAARTFCFYEDLKLLRSMGLTAGGSLENAIVFASGRALNPGGLRCPNEIARHKALDALGDLRLGGRLLGRYRGIKPGHSLNHRLLQKLFTSAAPTI